LQTQSTEDHDNTSKKLAVTNLEINVEFGYLKIRVPTKSGTDVKDLVQSALERNSDGAGASRLSIIGRLMAI